MKKIICIIVTILAIFQFPITVYAANDAEVYGNDASISKGEEAIIPIEIDNNDGIMGFKIMLDYDSNDISINDVTAGAITSTGNFVSNVGIKNGHIDIVWSNTKDITGSGTLFKISLKAISKFENSEIKITYSPNDTFNEKWEDVKLDCKNITINQSSELSSVSQPSTVIDTSTKETIVVSDKQIIDSISETLEELGYDSIDSVEENEQFVKLVNEKIKEKSGAPNYYNNDISNVKTDYAEKYKHNFANSIKENVSQKDIDDAVSKALKKSKAKSVSEVNNKEKFVADVQKELSKYYPDALNLSDNLNVDDVVDIIDEIYKDNLSKTYINIFVPVAIILFIIVVAIFLRRKSRKHYCFNQKKGE